MSGVVIAVLILLVILPSQLRLRPVLVGQLVIVPAIALTLGVAVLLWERPELTGTQVLYFGLQALVAAVTGVARGSIVEIRGRGGFAVRRGGWLMMGAWVATIGARVGVDVGVHAFAAAGAAVTETFPLFIGLTLAVQSVVLVARVRRKGLRFLTRDQLKRWRSGMQLRNSYR